MAPRRKKDEQPVPGVKFEEALEKLEASVKRLDSEELPLEEALSEYEKGLEALKLCRGILDAAQRKLEILVGEQDGEAEVEEFDPEAAEAGAGEARAAKTRAAAPKPPLRRPPPPAGLDFDSDDEDDGGHEPEERGGGGPRDGFLF
jgi:exodeoxyribonuclease VII small subunit